MGILNLFLLFLYKSADGALPDISPTGAVEPFLPLLAPSPLTPFTNHTVPKLSGLCVLNFSSAESLMSITAIDCWSIFAPMLANVICCPQFEATLAILIGQSSKETNMLALNGTLSMHCISDIEQILAGQGAVENLRQMCSIRPTNLTEGSCPVKYVNEFENNVDTLKLLAACKKIDPVKECCDQICQDAISEAATKIAMQDYRLLSMDGSRVLPEHSTKVDDCKSIVLRWLASKLNPSNAKEVLRGLSNCNVNRVCPLAFPDMRHVAKGCKNEISNTTVCCGAMESYVAHLQKQSLITNLQALDCATTLGMKLQKSNITRNIFSLCHLSLKDFSLQVKQESGCLLPSLPSDATLDQFTGISFICDLNDNIPAPWPSTSQLAAASCNKTVKIPALPAAASGQNGLYNEDLIYYLLFSSSVVITMLL
ncbi:hypothetical protein HS088_TW09G00216 [Tripterygium wilfordii]|uniref:SPARK domain-containing protein n=2 Tax=Tripterygium wilfordii TaxID=458696 RepID=A0A7J7D783_TRIWF|nr:uncharacterized GPI-anchored protein At1g61900-like isoform X1 [Tripterygium wilfordii]KAF5742174.1 hypothetical protein HS088_TW09G00216 [Tripterygium wilfordii]